MSDLLIGFRELQAGLLKLLSERSKQVSQSALAAGRVFKPQRDCKGKKGTKKREDEKEGSVSMSSSEGSNIFTYGNTQGGEKLLSFGINEGENAQTHRTSNVGWCFWCNGEDGRHHLARCEDLNHALKNRKVWRDKLGKLRWNKVYIPAQSHPRGMRGWVRDKEALEKVGIQMISNRRVTMTDWRERDPKSLRAFSKKTDPHSGVRNTKLPMLHELSPAASLEAEGEILRSSNEESVLSTSRAVLGLPEAWDSTNNLELPELPKDWYNSTFQNKGQIAASNPAEQDVSENLHKLLEKGGSPGSACLRQETTLTGDSAASVSALGNPTKGRTKPLLASSFSDCLNWGNAEVEKTTSTLAALKMIDRGVQTEVYLRLSRDETQEEEGRIRVHQEDLNIEEEFEKEKKMSVGQEVETGRDEPWREPRASSSDKPSGLLDQSFCCQDRQSVSEIWADLMELTEITIIRNDGDRTDVTPNCNVADQFESLDSPNISHQGQNLSDCSETLTDTLECQPLSRHEELNERTTASTSDKPCGVEAKFDVNSHPR
ncbi:hypothetical protein P7C70_g9269, partial [Phenoliferia sp. Uapishka_3]